MSFLKELVREPGTSNIKFKSKADKYLNTIHVMLYAESIIFLFLFITTALVLILPKIAIIITGMNLCILGFCLFKNKDIRIKMKKKETEKV